MKTGRHEVLAIARPNVVGKRRTPRAIEVSIDRGHVGAICKGLRCRNRRSPRFGRGMLWVKAVLTHGEYDRGGWK